MSNKSNKTHRTRSSITGRFLKTGIEKIRPNTTTREKVFSNKQKKIR